MLFFRYLRRVFPEIQLAGGLSSLLIGLGFLNISVAISILYVVNLAVLSFITALWVVLLIQDMYRQGTTYAEEMLVLFLSLALIATVGFVAFPHVYLFVSAFPFSIALSLISLNIFFLSFESILNVSRRNSQSDRVNRSFSLLNLLAFADARRDVYRALIGDEYDATRGVRPPRRQRGMNNRRWNASVNTRDIKILTQREVQDLTKRQYDLVAQLPKEAIIDDMGLYEKHKKIRLDQSTSKTTKEQVEALAKEDAEKEAKVLEKQYTNTIVGDSDVRAVQKIKAYQDYRETARTISPVYATCPISFEGVHPRAANMNFVLVEKSYYDTTTNSLYGVPTAKPSVIETNTFGTLLSAITPRNPLTQDPYSNPERYPNPLKPGESEYNRQTKQEDRYHARKGPSFPTYYRYHPYIEVAGHGLSLQLCNAIEEFLNPALVPRRRPDLNVPQKPSAKSATSDPKKYRKTPSVAPSSIASHNMFSRYSDQNLVELGLAQAELEQEMTDMSGTSLLLRNIGRLPS